MISEIVDPAELAFAQSEWNRKYSVEGSFDLQKYLTFSSYTFKAENELIQQATEASRSLDDKMEDIEIMKESEINADNIKRAINNTQEAFETALDGMAKDMSKSLKLPVYVRQVAREKYMGRISNVEKEAAGFRSNVQSAVQLNVRGHRKEENLSRMRVKKLKKEKLTQELKRKALTDSSESNVKEQELDYKERQEIIVASKATILQDKIQNEVNKFEKDKEETRQWRVKYWGAKLVTFRQEAVEARKTQIFLRKQTFLDSMTLDDNDWQVRERFRIENQVEGPVLDSSTLGVFGKVQKPHLVERHKSTSVVSSFENKLFGSVSDMKNSDDDRPSVLSSKLQSTEYEEKLTQLYECQAALKRDEDFYGSLIAERSAVGSQCELVDQVLRKIALDVAQMKSENEVLQRKVIGPPHREAARSERIEAHEHKININQLRQHETELKNKLQRLKEKIVIIDSQTLQLSVGISSKRERNKEMQSVIDGWILPIGNEPEAFGINAPLPVVVGKNIQKVSSIVSSVIANPREVYNNVLHQSKVEVMKNDAWKILESHKQTKAVENDIWLLQLQSRDTSSLMQESLSKAAAMTVKIKQMNQDRTRRSLVSSVEAFVSASYQLNKVEIHHKGPIPWWLLRDSELARNVTRWSGYQRESEDAHKDSLDSLSDDDEDTIRSIHLLTRSELATYGVRLDNHKVGFLMGFVMMPKLSIWKITLSVGRKNIHTNEQPDCQDRVIVKFGPALSSMSTVATLYNIRNAATGLFRYDVEYQFRGDGLGFRFEFISSSACIDAHFGVTCGTYEEIIIPPLTEVRKENNERRVVSSLVVEQRITDKQEKPKMETLVLDLIDAEEDYKADFHDSSTITGYRQRFSMKVFKKLIRAEIFMQLRSDKEEKQRRESNKKSKPATLRPLLEDASAADSMRMTSIHDEAEKQGKRDKFLAHSETNCMKRFKNKHKNYVDYCNSLIGKRIELLGQDKKSWSHAVIMSCQIYWRDGGTVPDAHHQVQMLDDGLNGVGACQDVVLKKRKFYESSDSKQDAVLINRWKESEKIKAAALEIDRKANERIEKVTRSVNESQSLAIKNFEQHMAETIAERQLEIVDEVEHEASSFEVQTLMEEQAKEICSRGTSFSTTPSPTEILAQKNQFLDNWKSEKTLIKMVQLQDEFNEKKALLTKLHNTERDKLESDCRMTLRVARERIELIHDEDKRKRQEIREKKISSLKIEGFSAVTSTAHSCEHLKTKHWGNNYGKGIRCLDCGKELTTLHDDRNQELGYGTGGNAQLDADVISHRENESAFRCTDVKQRLTINNERVRLEKERRVIQEAEIGFYDLPDILPNYEFDVRHQRELKASGIMREGVQWSAEEFTKFIDDRRQKEITQAEQQGLLACAIEKSIDPLYGIEDPAPTFRATDERHKMQNKELMRTMARMSQYELKLSEIKGIRVILLGEKINISAKLNVLHFELRNLESFLASLESEIDRLHEMLNVKNQMDMLWKSANDILHQATVSFKKAEMKCVGKREQAAECDVKVGKIIEESKDICRREFLLLEEIDIVETATVGMQSEDVDTWIRFSDLQDDYQESCFKVRGRLVATPYGQLRVRRCREADSMLMFFLPFCGGRSMLYMPLKKVVSYERSLQRAELEMMGHEDITMKALSNFESICNSRERACMIQEDDLATKLRAQETWIKWENEQVNLFVKDSVNRASSFVLLPIFRLQGRVEAEIRVREEMQKKEVEIKAFKGSGKRPKQMSRWKRYRRVQQLVSDIASEFVQKTAADSSVQRKKELGFISHWKCEQDIMEVLLQTALQDEILNICKETIEEGVVAKKKAEDDSGIHFSRPSNMQYSVYYQLRESWKERKRNLKIELVLHGSKLSRLMQSMQEASLSSEEYAESMKQKEEENSKRKNQMGFAILMAQEDARMKDFVRLELSLCLDERRQMQQEDQLGAAMRNMMKQRDKKPSKSMSRKKLDGSESESDDEERNAVTKYHVRRIQIKRGLHSRRLLAKERRLMQIEDDLSRELRYSNPNLHKSRVNLRTAILSSKVDPNYVSSDESSLCSEDDPSKQDWTTENIDIDENEQSVKNRKRFRKRKSLIIGGKKTDISKVVRPRHWDSLTEGQMINWERLARHEERESMRQTKTRWTVVAKEVMIEKKEASNWMREKEMKRLESMEAELIWMETDERRKDIECRLVKLRENLRKIKLYSQQKGLEEARTIENSKRMWLLADHCDAEYKDALSWLDDCKWRSKSRSKVKRKVDELCGWSDTSSITGYYQRWETNKLLKRLQQIYVETNIRSIINRAELVIVERRSQGISEMLSINSRTLISKNSQMGLTWRQHQINELCRLKRSELTKRLFKNSCYKTIAQAWSGWIKYHHWYKGCKMAFELRYNLIKNELDLKRLWKEKMDSDQSFEYITSDVNSNIEVSNLERHLNRPIECANCGMFFLESQNHSMICRYHPETFKLACPQSCPGLTPKCMSHRRRRWTCCDKTEEGSRGSNGCRSKYHVPVTVDPIYDRLMGSIASRDASTERDLDVRLSKLDGNDWERELFNAKRDQLQVTEEFMKQERDIVASYANIKFV